MREISELHFEQAAELIETLFKITCNGVDPKDFARIRDLCYFWLRENCGATFDARFEKHMEKKVMARARKGAPI